MTLLLLGIIIACAGKDTKNASEEVADGEKLYKKHCVICHGVNGKLGINGAKDITLSLLNPMEREILIRSGKTTMTPFENILSPEAIKAVAEYTMTLR